MTIHWIYVYIKNSTGQIVGTLVLQHTQSLWSSTHHISISLGNPAVYNNVQIGKMTSDTSSTGGINKNCWSGAHVHEDLDHNSTHSWVPGQLGTWAVNGSKFANKKGTPFGIKDTSAWTRMLTYDFSS